MGFPPTTSRAAAESTNTVTFNYQFPGFAVSRTGITSVLTVPVQYGLSCAAISASAIDWSTANSFSKTLGAGTTFTFSNAIAGQTIVVRLTNTASNYTVTWPTVKWAGGTPPTMSPGAVSDVYTFFYDGTSFFGSAVQNMS